MRMNQDLAGPESTAASGQQLRRRTDTIATWTAAVVHHCTSATRTIIQTPTPAASPNHEAPRPSSSVVSPSCLL